MNKTPWWEFWNPMSGVVGGIIAGLAAALVVFSLLVIAGAV